MSAIFLAFGRSLVSLTRARVWAMVLTPAGIALLLWLALVIWGREPLYGGLMQCPPMPQLVKWEVAWLAKTLAYVGSWMLTIAVAYFTTALLAAILVMPWLLDYVAKRDYPDLAALGADSFTAAALNSLIATVVFVAAWLITIPLWLIPGMSLVLPLLLVAWYNRRTFAYDALSLHATPDEWGRIRKENRRNLFLIGLLMAILVYIPLFGLLAPTLTALTFIHYGLESLRRLRGDALVAGEARVVLEGEFSEER